MVCPSLATTTRLIHQAHVKAILEATALKDGTRKEICKLHDIIQQHLRAAKVVDEAFYVDDCLTGANTVEEAIELQRQLRDLFSEADFVLRKWNSSSPALLQAIPPDLRDTQTSLTISSSEDIYTKTLGTEWHSVIDHFQLSVTNSTPPEALTKRALVSDIAKTYDVLGWFAPAISK